MKKLLALLLALAMMICLVACGEEKTEAPKEEGAQQEDKAPAADQEQEKDDEKKEEAKKDDDLEGTWECEMNYAEFLDAALIASEMPESILPDKDVAWTVALVVEDGKIALNFIIDEDEFDAYMDALTENMTEYMYAEYEKQGLSKEEADAKSKEDNDGKTVPESAAFAVAENKESLFAMNAEGDPEYYKVEDGRIYLSASEDSLDDSKSYMEFELDGDELTVTAFGDAGKETNDPFGVGVESLQLPWVFTK